MTKCEYFSPSPEANKKITKLWDEFEGGQATHEELCGLMIKLPSDFVPYGERDRDKDYGPDCSCGCKHFHALEGKLSSDWGVCWNKDSPRCGLLTFEHQGCKQFVSDPRYDDLHEDELKIMREDKKKHA